MKAGYIMVGLNVVTKGSSSAKMHAILHQKAAFFLLI
jgi:hypothetical protein